MAQRITFLQRCLKKADFETAFNAQIAGFAETDPLLDVKGIDALNKLTILLTHAYGLIVSPEDLIYSGLIVCSQVIRCMQLKSAEIKLVAQAQKIAPDKICAFVL